jgi:hypothetical protein
LFFKNQLKKKKQKQKQQQKPKNKYVLDVFALFSIFLASFSKNLKLKKIYFQRFMFLTCLFKNL